jgi:glycosyltransferase involved in cell wall biosynthesis
VATTIIVEPAAGGHRFPYVRYIVDSVSADADLLLLTSPEAAASVEFDYLLGDVTLRVDTSLSSFRPSTHELAEAIARRCRSEDVDTVVLMDADAYLPTWWREARQAFRGLQRRPTISFLLTRYPPRVTLTDWHGWAHRVSKGLLALLAMATRTLDLVATISGHDDASRGLFVRRVRNPSTALAHARDRDQIRAELGLPAHRTLIGILGAISDDKNVPLVFAATQQLGADADLVLAGRLEPSVATWVGDRTEADRRRVLVRDEFLSESEMDRFIAACDVIAVANNYNRPSAVMGKALAAGVPVVSAASTIRAHDLRNTGGGVDVALSADGLAGGFRTVLAGGYTGHRPDAKLGPPTPAELTAALLGSHAGSR